MKTKSHSTFHMSFSKSKYVKKLVSDIIRDKYLYLLIVPIMLFYIIFQFKPMYGLQIAFRDYSLFKGIEGSPWVGLENFRNFFQGPYFMRTLRNTLLINLYGLIVTFPAPIVFALLINEVRNVEFKRLAQTAVYLPHFMSTVIIAGIIINFLSPSSGIVNLIIEKLGGEKIYFMVKPQYFRTIYIGMNLWKETGFSSIIYISALSGINQELYEACRIDGGKRWRQTIHITLPGILPTIMVMLILRVANMLEVGYESIILLYQPSTYETADVISSYVYRAGLQQAQYGLASAVDLTNAVVSLLLVSAANYISKKITEVGIW